MCATTRVCTAVASAIPRRCGLNCCSATQDNLSKPVNATSSNILHHAKFWCLFLFLQEKTHRCWSLLDFVVPSEAQYFRRQSFSSSQSISAFVVSAHAPWNEDGFFGVLLFCAADYLADPCTFHVRTHHRHRPLGLVCAQSLTADACIRCVRSRAFSELVNVP